MFALQFLDQRQNLRLGGDIERGGRLIGDEDRRLQNQRHRDHRALALTAGDLVRIGAQDPLRIGETDFLEQREDSSAALACAKSKMNLEHLVDLPADGHQRVEGRHRLLEDHRDPRAAHRAHALGRGLQKILAIEKHAPAGHMHMRRGQQAHDRARQHRFSGTGFADHADDLVAGELD